jgi:hypothetical protein
VYDNNTDGRFDGADKVIYAANNVIPVNGTVLLSDPHLKFVDTDRNGIWDPGETIVYDANQNGVFDAGDILVGPITTAPPRGAQLRSDPKIMFVDSDGNGIFEFPQPPPAMSDGTERCVDPNVKLSNGKDWVIITWSYIGTSLGCK